MSKRKTIHAFACVGSNGAPFCCWGSPHEALVGRFEIFDTQKAAERMAISKAHVRKVRIILGDYTADKPGEKP